MTLTFRMCAMAGDASVQEILHRCMLLLQNQHKHTFKADEPSHSENDPCHSWKGDEVVCETSGECQNGLEEGNWHDDLPVTMFDTPNCAFECQRKNKCECVQSVQSCTR